jgi:hypothetical protein
MPEGICVYVSEVGISSQWKHPKKTQPFLAATALLRSLTEACSQGSYIVEPSECCSHVCFLSALSHLQSAVTLPDMRKEKRVRRRPLETSGWREYL